jgi:hypothetical protein
MPRLSLVAAGVAALLLSSAVTRAGGPPGTVPPGEAKPVGYFSPDNPIVVGPAQTIWPESPPHSHFGFGARLKARLLAENSGCGPDGCPKPLGCGNHWTELKWIFGSCREFFGTAGSAVGEGPGTFIP